MLDRHNEHLGDNVREGEVIVLVTREPKSAGEFEELKSIKTEANKITQILHSASEEEAKMAVRYLPLFDSVVTSETYSKTNSVSGSIVAGLGGLLKSIEDDLRAINKLFVDEVVSAGSLRTLSSDFYIQRANLFKKIDSKLHKLVFNCVGITTYKKLKNTLGLSVKSVAYHGDELVNTDGVLKGLSTRLDPIVKWVKNSKLFGLLSVALDSLQSIPVIEEAFTSEEGKPIEVASIEAARVYGGYSFGNIGARAGAGLATVVVGTLGGGPITIGIACVAGGVAGAYYGAKMGSKFATGAVTYLFKLTDSMQEYAGEHGGFFNWNAEQM